MSNVYHEKNRIAWNQAATEYRKHIADTVAFLSSGRVSMQGRELPYLLDLGDWCDLAIHLQCAGGKDTLSLLNLGARRVVGLDISEAMLDVAHATACQLKAPARWIRSDVIEAPTELDGTADLVYTGRGAVIWMHDLERWAATVARLLKPGGRFYMYEGHPLTYLFDPKAAAIVPDPSFDGYFANKALRSNDWPVEYLSSLDIPADQLTDKFERVWPVSSIINALLGQGLELLRFEEYPDGYWDEFPKMPEPERRRFPNTYSLLCRKR